MLGRVTFLQALLNALLVPPVFGCHGVVAANGAGADLMGSAQAHSLRSAAPPCRTQAALRRGKDAHAWSRRCCTRRIAAWTAAPSWPPFRSWRRGSGTCKSLQGERYRTEAVQNIRQAEILKPTRGVIYDRKNRELAVNRETWESPRPSRRTARQAETERRGCSTRSSMP